MVPAKSTDSTHNVRLVFGNGLRKEIWPQFIERFKISQVCEFYGATEGNSNLVSFDNKVGAVGFVPHFAKMFYPVTLVKSENEQPIRNENGKCIKCKTGEVGLFIGKINPKHAARSFAGYADKVMNTLCQLL